MQRIVPFIWFVNDAKGAAEKYSALFKNSRIVREVCLPDTPGGDVDLITLELFGREFQFMDSDGPFELNPAVYYMVACDTVEEVDCY